MESVTIANTGSEFKSNVIRVKELFFACKCCAERDSFLHVEIDKS